MPPKVSGGNVAASPKPLVDAETLSLRPDQLEYLELILMAIVIGVLAALGNIGFRGLIDFFSWVFRDLEWNALGIVEGTPTALLIPVILVSGGLAILLLNLFFPGDVLGYGFPNFLEMVNLGHARIKRRWIVVKALGAALSLGAGASVGREGPIAQIGGAIGSGGRASAAALGRSGEGARCRGRGRGDRDDVQCPDGRSDVCAGNRPDGSDRIDQRGAGRHRYVLCCGDFPDTVGPGERSLSPGNFRRDDVLGNVELRATGRCARNAWRRLYQVLYSAGRYIRGIKLPQWAKLLIGLAAVGAIAIALPRNLSDGYPVIDLALNGKLGFTMLVALAAAKFVASTISLDCGTPGGVFGPVFFIGATSGGAFREIVRVVVPGIVGPRGSYSLIGLGAFLAAVTHAPLTALFLCSR